MLLVTSRSIERVLHYSIRKSTWDEIHEEALDRKVPGNETLREDGRIWWKFRIPFKIRIRSSRGWSIEIWIFWSCFVGQNMLVPMGLLILRLVIGLSGESWLIRRGLSMVLDVEALSVHS